MSSRSHSASVFVDGSVDEIHAYLESVFGTRSFRLVGDVIELELPEVGTDRRPRPSGETTIVSFRAPRDWTIQAPEGGSWSHVVPSGQDSTLCGISLSSWTSRPRERLEESVNCPWCRARLVAVEIAAPPAMRRIRWTDQCVYTMRHTRDLDECRRTGGHARWHEKRAWRKGRELLDRSAAGDVVPVIFSAAEVDSGLIFFGQLESVDIVEDGTSYTISSLQPLPHPQPLSALILASSGQPLSEAYIRPYAICETPMFLPPPEEAHVGRDEWSVTLHDEMAAILRESGEPGLTTEALAQHVNARARYRKRDGTAVDAFQIFGRARNYPHIFERDGDLVRLCDG